MTGRDSRCGYKWQCGVAFDNSIAAAENNNTIIYS